MLNTIIDYPLIGQRIKKRRNERKLTQEQLANALNISVYYLSKIENGKASATLEMLALIAHQLELELAYLITGVSTLEKHYYTDKLQDICEKATSKQLDMIIRLSKVILDD